MVEDSLEAAVQGSGDGRLTGLRAVIPVIQNSVEEVSQIAMALRPLTLDDLELIVTIGWFLINGLAECIVTRSFART